MTEENDFIFAEKTKEKENNNEKRVGVYLSTSYEHQQEVISRDLVWSADIERFILKMHEMGNCRSYIGLKDSRQHIVDIVDIPFNNNKVSYSHVFNSFLYFAKLLLFKLFTDKQHKFIDRY